MLAAEGFSPDRMARTLATRDIYSVHRSADGHFGHITCRRLAELRHAKLENLMPRKCLVTILACLLCASQAFAGSQQTSDAIEIDTYDNFQVLVGDLREEMVVGGRYEYLAGMDRKNVNRMLDAIAELLRSSGSFATMSPGAKTALLADLEAVNELLAKFADNRIICTHEAPIGSLIPRKRCRTLRQIEKSRSASKGRLMDIQKDSSLGNE